MSKYEGFYRVLRATFPTTTANLRAADLSSHRCAKHTLLFLSFGAGACSANSAKMALFAIVKAMKRDQMLMEAILGKLLETPEPQLNVAGVAQRLNAEQSVIHHHLHLLEDKGWVTESQNGYWRLTNAGHDYLEGTPEQGISLRSLG